MARAIEDSPRGGFISTLSRFAMRMSRMGVLASRAYAGALPVRSFVIDFEIMRAINN